jgi:hypothetical protein
LLLWVAGILLVALLGLYIKRMLEARGIRLGAPRFTAPSHVRDLDIRPESLPDDIGAAALNAWERNEQRLALSLLYRGLLSRLAHGYGAPIRQSSTEGDCLMLATRYLTADRTAYVSRLIRVWQAAVYGGALPANEEVGSLCAEFHSTLDPPSGLPPQVEQAA